MVRKLGLDAAVCVNFMRAVECAWTSCRPRAARTRAGRVRATRGPGALDRAQDYLEYLRGTGIADYRATPGNHGVEVLLRTEGDRTQFTLITYWESLEAVKRFAGDQPEVARFYPEDDDYLIDRELTVEHHEVARIQRG